MHYELLYLLDFFKLEKHGVSPALLQLRRKCRMSQFGTPHDGEVTAVQSYVEAIDIDVERKEGEMMVILKTIYRYVL